MRQALRTTATRTIRISGKAQYRQPCRYSLPRHFPPVKRKAGAQGKPLEETAEQRNPKYTALSDPRYGQPRPVREDAIREFPPMKNCPPPPIGRSLTLPHPLPGPLDLAQCPLLLCGCFPQGFPLLSQDNVHVLPALRTRFAHSSFTLDPSLAQSYLPFPHGFVPLDSCLTKRSLPLKLSLAQSHLPFPHGFIPFDSCLTKRSLPLKLSLAQSYLPFPHGFVPLGLRLTKCRLPLNLSLAQSYLPFLHGFVPLGLHLTKCSLSLTMSASLLFRYFFRAGRRSRAAAFRGRTSRLVRTGNLPGSHKHAKGQRT